MNKPIKWGIIGPGIIANRFATACVGRPGATLHGVASRDLARAKAFANTYSIATYHDSYEALATDPDIDAIYIAVPHTGHCAETLLCLKHGKAVLCEKPLTLNHALASTMVNAARTHNIFLMEAMWTRFIPAIIKAKELIDQGAIGTVNYLRADFGVQAEYDPSNRSFNLALGGGAMLDLGVYPLFLALYMLGKPTGIKAVSKLAATGADQTTNALLSFADGSIASILSSFAVKTPANAEIIGTEGTITIHAPWYQATALTISSEKGKPQLLQFPYPGNGFEFQIDEVIQCLQNGQKESLLMPLDFSLLLAEVSDEIRRQCGIRYAEDIV